MPNGPALGFFSIIFRKYGTTGPVIVNVVIGTILKIRRRSTGRNLQRGNPCHRKPLAGIHPIVNYHSPIINIDIGMPSRAFPVTPPGIRVRTTAVRLVKLFPVLPITKQVMPG
ncbi:MAG: hypothetical protein IIC00_09915, partial [Planctomycetes bacterium]|nr:hypothetical protein [Planctomycetota bacterium]